jgi:hypothetical protein
MQIVTVLKLIHIIIQNKYFIEIMKTGMKKVSRRLILHKLMTNILLISHLILIILIYMYDCNALD